MIEVKHFEEVTQFRMGRDIGGQVLYWVAAYLVDGLLIDTGCSYTAKELAKLLKEEPPKLAVNTHYHEDHIGANHILKQKFGIKIFASPESIPFINRIPKLLPYEEYMWGYPEPTHVEPLPKTIETAHFHFDVIDTPGHCPGHVALVEPGKGWCFSGDLFVSRDPMGLRPEDDITETVKSMKKLIVLKTDRLILFTSLGNVVQDGRESLQSCIQYFKDLSQRAKELQKQGLSPGAIRDEIFGRETVLAEPTEGDFSAENMIRAVLRADIEL
jgi:hydroxyacylglutathione hydrolase